MSVIAPDRHSVATRTPQPAAARVRSAGPPPVVRWINLAKAAITSGAIVLLVSAGALALVSEPPETDRSQLDLSTSRVDAMFERNRCSVTGFGSDVIPARALIRRESGRTAMVSFDHGWAIFSGERPGELMAVCLGPAGR